MHGCETVALLFHFIACELRILRVPLGVAHADEDAPGNLHLAHTQITQLAISKCQRDRSGTELLRRM